jgi:hypothetical protein
LVLLAFAIVAGTQMLRGVDPQRPETALAGFKAHVGIGLCVACGYAIDPAARTLGLAP